MIHECLLNLWRCPIPQKSDKEWVHLFQLDEFLHPGEQKLLQIILDVTSDYHKITSFNRSVINEMVDDSEQFNHKSKGLYISAFCNGIHSVLEGYRNEIMKLEELFLQNPQLSLTFILSVVEKYKHIFQTLLSMIKKIQGGDIYGCLLIGRLHKYGYCEVDNITSSAKLIIKTINQIFHKQLCNWIIYGDLIDIYEEFFIVDEKMSDENFLYPEQLLEINESDKENSKKLVYMRKSKIRRPPYVKKFSINWQMVPVFINEDIAENILFIGRIVWILRNDPKTCSSDGYQINSNLELEEKDKEYYKTLKDLEVHAFNNIEFQQVMDRCRNNLTKYLWSVMLSKGNLVEHLQNIRDYFGLGRGELFQHFVLITEAHLKDTPSNSTVQKLNYLFLETARKIYGENDKTYLKFELTSTSNITEKNPWTQLQLNFEINWPLHIVFHPTVMALYNKLFCFLLRLKKTQVDLHKLWVNHISSNQQFDRRIGTLRQNLIFLVNNLQYYLQVDVIEAQFSLLMQAVQNANEFVDIIKVHHEFISNLLIKSFVATSDDQPSLKNKNQLYQIPSLQCGQPSKVYNIIIKLLELCDKFCLVTSTWDAVLTEPEIEELEAFKKQSDSIIETFLFILYQLHDKVSGQHLLQLLLQLDFNRYFSKSTPNLNFTIFI